MSINSQTVYIPSTFFPRLPERGRITSSWLDQPAAPFGWTVEAAAGQPPRCHTRKRMIYLIIAKLFPLIWAGFFATVSFIAVKRLDKPNLSVEERNRLKLYVIVLTAFSAIYGHMQTQKIEERMEVAAAAIPGIQTDLKQIGLKLGDIPNIKEWMAFRLKETPQGKAKEPELALVTSSVEVENRNMPPELRQLIDKAAKDNSDQSRIALGHAYIMAKRYTLARQVFESVIQTSQDYLNTEIAALLAKALRSGLGEKLANRELGLAWVLQWDEEPHYTVTAHLSDDKINWVAITLEPSNPAGSVIPFPLKQYIRVSAAPSGGAGRQPKLYSNTIMLSMGLVDKNHKLFHPLLLTKPQRIE